VPRILLAEDDPEMGALVERGLVGDGYDVQLVTTGLDALLALAPSPDDGTEAPPFDAAAIDVMLPGMTGFEVCRRLREAGATLPVIMITARDALDDRIFGLDAGADDYLTKPFAVAELSARLRAQLRRRGVDERTTVALGGLRMDSIALRATADGRSMPLSVKEFGLLRFVARRPGVVVSRTEVLDEVWGSHEHFDPSIVDQYVSYVRKKLAAAGSDVVITTVRGSGYRADVVPSGPDETA
jgi:two-component system OmpR family response regulator